MKTHKTNKFALPVIIDWLDINEKLLYFFGTPSEFEKAKLRY